MVEGQTVMVPFGKSKIYTGIVWKLHTNKPNFKTIKYITRSLYDHPLLCREQMLLWDWIADYYICTLGEVMRVALPSLMKPSGGSEAEFSEDEFRPRQECYISLDESLFDDAHFGEILAKVARRAPKQAAALEELRGVDKGLMIEGGYIARRLLNADRQVLNVLSSKGLAHITMRERTIEQKSNIIFQLPTLTKEQTIAYDRIRDGFKDTKTALLHGITGSGKTEIYIHLIAEVLARGGDVLLLVPEIALTSQLIERMERIFGSRVTSYHSKLPNVKRSELYLQLSKSEGGNFVVGVRSSIYLPLKNLQLTIVDEEHDSSYKQSDPAPRYNARDCAVVMATLFGGHALLGSATPALETWYNAKSGKYNYASLNVRYGEAKPPRISISDTIRAVKRGERKAHFNKLLLDKMEHALGAKEQVMLFQNRRGFSPYIECGECGWTGRCTSCNVTMSYHKVGGRLVCHYCGYTIPAPSRCPSCKVADVLPKGFGTEKVEEEIVKIFPESRVVRLDRDTLTSERAFNHIIRGFENGDSDIMVGTQMITKGFDFGGVSLVGILNADNMLNTPDFRASERAYQLMTQVSGRAGRRGDNGEVVIQTSDPLNPILREVVDGDYESMANSQLSERREFSYPPFSRLIKLEMRHADVAILRSFATVLSSGLRAIFGRRILGPIAPPIDRVRGEYIVELMVKIEIGASMSRARGLLKTEVDNVLKRAEYKKIIIIYNVDPQ